MSLSPPPRAQQSAPAILAVEKLELKPASQHQPYQWRSDRDKEKSEQVAPHWPLLLPLTAG